MGVKMGGGDGMPNEEGVMTKEFRSPNDEEGEVEVVYVHMYISLDCTMSARMIKNKIDTLPLLPGDTLRGICELEDDSLRICFCTVPGGERPTAFETEPGANLCLGVLKRHQVDRTEAWTDVRLVNEAGESVEGGP
jgi:hypothetical protein